MGNDLQGYHTDAQRLLHDSSYQFYTQQELTDYANKARRKVAAETGCLRQVVASWPLGIGVKTIAYNNSIITGRRVTGLLDIYLNNGSTRLPLFYYPYSQFSRLPIVAYNYTGPPEVWSQVGAMAYIARVPGVAYTLDFDASIEPLDLVNLTDVDNEIVSPFNECVKFYMCYLAKLKDQRRPEAEAFLVDYVRERNTVASSTMIRKLVGS